MNSTFATDYLVIPLNLSSKEILNIAETAYYTGKKVVLNSMPPQKVRRKLLKYISLAILDEEQMSELMEVDIKDIEDAKIAALKLYGRGAETVMIKMKIGKTLVFDNEVFSIVQEFDMTPNLSLTDVLLR